MKRPAKAETVDEPPAEDDPGSTPRNLEAAFEEVADDDKPKRKKGRAPREKAPKKAKAAKGGNPEGEKEEKKDEDDDTNGDAKKGKSKRPRKKSTEKKEGDDGEKAKDEEMKSLLKSKATFAGRYPPSTSVDARNRFIAIVSTYMSKIEPLISSTTCTQAGQVTKCSI